MSVAPIVLLVRAWNNFAKSNNLSCFVSPICWFVSVRNIAVMITAISDTMAAIIKGYVAFVATVAAEIIGPNINPNPKDAPIIPKPFARSFGGVVSVITAVATGIFPAVIPSNARAIKRKIALGANAMRRNEATVPLSEIMSNGRLPYLSDSLPMIGVDKNWHKENVANNRPF